MPSDFQFDVFLSHSAKDMAVVRPLAERLRADELKLPPCLSLRRPGQGHEGFVRCECDLSQPRNLTA
jgi:hypothetical protein